LIILELLKKNYSSSKNSLKEENFCGKNTRAQTLVSLKGIRAWALFNLKRALEFSQGNDRCRPRFAELLKVRRIII
jgi:hypothetical protein